MSEEPAGITLPKWFLSVCAGLLILLTVGVIPWANSISTSIEGLKDEVVEVRIRMESQAAMRKDIEHIRDSMSRFEKRLERLEQK